jgi:hypothetical protein
VRSPPRRVGVSHDDDNSPKFRHHPNVVRRLTSLYGGQTTHWG